MRLILAGLFAIMPMLVHAQCSGADVRPALDPALRGEIAAAAATEPNGNGNFWRAVRGDQVLTLVGTVHIDDARLDPLAEKLADDIVAADLVYLEMTGVEQEQLEAALVSRPDMVLLSEGSLIDLLPEETWAALSAAAEARGLPPFMAARMQPWYLSLVLALPPCVTAAGTPRGLDARVEERADAAGIPTQALEPYDTLFKMFGEEPLETQLEFLSASVMDDQDAQDMMATTLNTYFEEAGAELWHLSRVMARETMDMPSARLDALFDDLEQTLLIERNRAWVEQLKDAQGESFVAVGAAHLFGEEGLVALLRNEGFTVTRISP